MPKRRRSVTLTPRKRPKRLGNVTNVVQGDPDAPTEAEWRTWKEFGSFIVRDEEDEEHTFKKGDVARILPPHTPQGRPPHLHEYWVGKIQEVRAQDEEDVWTRVQWYWSGPEVAAVVKTFDSDSCGRYERIFSDQLDFVSTAAYDGVVKMRQLSEDSLDQPHIRGHEFYTRYNFQHEARVIEPKPGIKSCICSLPYRPDDDTALMHFCPRPSCRRFYHSVCLAAFKNSAKGKSVAFSDPLHFLSSSPDSDSPIDIECLAPAAPPPVTEQRTRSSRGMGRKTVHELLSQLPPDLVRVAQQPIVRGGAWMQGGVSGNVRVVVNARRMLYEAIQGGRGVQDGWEVQIGLREQGESGEDWLDKAVVKIGKKAPVWACPKCGGPI